MEKSYTYEHGVIHQPILPGEVEADPLYELGPWDTDYSDVAPVGYNCDGTIIYG